LFVLLLLRGDPAIAPALVAPGRWAAVTTTCSSAHASNAGRPDRHRQREIFALVRYRPGTVEYEITLTQAEPASKISIGATEELQ
jgi:hypothetical protein